MTAVKPEVAFEVERLAAKTVCAAEFLAETIQEAAALQKLENRVKRYVRQASLIVTWKRSSGVFKMVGSAAKTAGNVMVLAAPLNPRLGLAVTAGHRLWKLGTGLKVLTAISGMLRELWHSGCRNTLVEYTKSVALLTSKLGVFQEIITDLQGVTAQLNSNNNGSFETPAEIIHVMSEFVPQHHLVYASHIMNIVFGDKHYSPLFDMITVSSDPANQTDLAQVIREVEGFRFTEFAENSDAKALVAIGSFLHISRELLDFLDGFQKVTDVDCRFIQDCLTKFSDESLNIIKVVSLLNGLSKVKQSLQSSKDNVSNSEINSNNNDQITNSTISNKNKVLEESFKSTNSTAEDETQQLEDTNDSLRPSQETVTVSDIDDVPIYYDNVQYLTSTIERANIVTNAKGLVNKALSSVSVVVEKGTEIMTSFKIKKQNQYKQDFDSERLQFSKTNESLNQI